jgi:predicted DCC family thiol-disulfide oxidoreductase YuxK
MIENRVILMIQTRILIYDPKCPKCRFIGKIVRIFDISQKFKYYNLRSSSAAKLLHEFFRVIPYNFHFIIDDKDLCYTGIKAIPLILYEIITGLLWPYGSSGPYWIAKSSIKK